MTSKDIIEESPEDFNPWQAESVELALPDHDPSHEDMPGNIYYEKYVIPWLKKWPD
jgi:hypothetical protein